ncbi:MAG: T9SS type A sorting domain-containing protein [Ignavibacteriales bacterium]|nr:MAG: T9SS type A sorting domain-containing protein [Ignavibacteriales bacterium]
MIKLRSLLFVFVFTVLSCSSFLFAQPSSLPYYIQGYQHESGLFNGSNDGTDIAQLAFSTIVDLNNVPWISLHFAEANLGAKSYMIITSQFDGKWQRLDAVSLRQWNYYSAYFNRGAVEIKLFVHPSDEKIYFNIDEVSVGEWANDTDSQCGPTDDRVASNQLATGRLLSIGCTAWIIPNGHFISAGHCLDGSGATVVQFQVPLSLPGGTLQHPGPEDQYSVDVSTKVFTNGGIGNDWGTFEVFPNSVTGLMPKQAQNAFWPLVQDLTPPNIRITGYGVDDGTANQTQQTHVGPNASSSGNTMRYVTDTEGGNSGSPVIDDATGNAVGVHTHGGCTTSGTGNNNGTSLFHAAFWTAVEQGAGGCPVEPPTTPSPANNATDVSINIPQLTWTNGAGAVTNQLYFGTNPAALTLVQSGTLATSWNVTGLPLDYMTTYYWRVVEVGDSCNTNGPTWSFSTVQDPNLVTLFFDNFEASTDTVPVNFTVTNDGGTLVWRVFGSPYPNAYTMPASSSGKVFSADSDEGGSGTGPTTLLSTATLTNPINCGIYQTVTLEFDSDWNAIDAADSCYVQVSNNGTTWVNYLTYGGVDVRNTHVMLDISATAALQSTVWVRFKSVQPGWDWWWTIDNVSIIGTNAVPVELASFTASANDTRVVLDWLTATETNNLGFEVQRKSGDEFVALGFVDGNGTTTEAKNYSFTDSKVPAGKQVYRLKQIDFDGAYEYSNEVEVDVAVPKAYSLEQNYPNPFNPSTIIKYSLPVDAKITLKVFDVIGQEVMTLLNSSIASGTHEVTFDASNLNSGVYFYTIDAKGVDGNNFTSTKKMLIVK